MRDLKTLHLCKQCETKKEKCPYPAAFNSQQDGHQACDEAFTQKTAVA